MVIKSEGQDELEVEREASEGRDRQLSWGALHRRGAENGCNDGLVRIDEVSQVTGLVRIDLGFGGKEDDNEGSSLIFFKVNAAVPLLFSIILISPPFNFQCMIFEGLGGNLFHLF